MTDRELKNQKIKETLLMTKQRRQYQTCKVFKVKIQENSLTKTQRNQLKMMFVEAKWFVNDMLSWSQYNDKPLDQYKPGKTVDVKTKDGTKETRVLSCLTSSYRQGLQEELRSNIKTLATRKKKGYKVGKLKFRSYVKSIPMKQNGVTHRIIDSKHVKIQGIKSRIRVNGLNQFVGEKHELANAKLLNTPTGYYIAFTAYFDQKVEKQEFLPEIGVDMGCSTTITTSEGNKMNAQVEEPVRLKRLQRRLSRQTKNFSLKTNNSRRTRRLIRREYQKNTNRKMDMANKIVHNLLRHERVFIQDENLSAWQKSGHGRKIQHGCLGTIKAKLMRSNRVVVVDRMKPTTRFCECRHVNRDIKLWDRTFVCPQCGLTEDRDVHAAKNMIWFGKLSLGGEPTESTPVETECVATGNENVRKQSPVVETGRCQHSCWR